MITNDRYRSRIVPVQPQSAISWNVSNLCS